jgi:hypothetical protein
MQQFVKDFKRRNRKRCPTAMCPEHRSPVDLFPTRTSQRYGDCGYCVIETAPSKDKRGADWTPSGSSVWNEGTLQEFIREDASSRRALTQSVSYPRGRDQRR